MYTPYPLRHSADEFLRRATSVARHSGFNHIDEVKADPARRQMVPSLDSKQRRIDAVNGEIATLLRESVQRGLLPSREPLLLYHSSPGAGKTNAPFTFGLQIIGTKQTIAEALILKTAAAIIEETGIKNAVIRLNSIGDRDSTAKFHREVQAYLRRNLQELPAAAQQALRDDVFFALEALARKRHALYTGMPRPMEFLTSASRKHLREVLELIESAQIQYEIDELLVAHRDCYAHTLFEIRATDEEGNPVAIVAKGGRYDELPRRLFNFKAPVPSVGIVFTVTPASPLRRITVAVPRSSKPPKVCFIHVGFEARRKSLLVVDAFRRARVPFLQCLHHERLTDQLMFAESAAVPYTVIMGQKEALEDTVIIRNVATRAQQVVPLTSLPTFFKQFPLA